LFDFPVIFRHSVQITWHSQQESAENLPQFSQVATFPVTKRVCRVSLASIWFQMVKVEMTECFHDSEAILGEVIRRVWIKESAEVDEPN
jgi:hypothetical protein